MNEFASAWSQMSPGRTVPKLLSEPIWFAAVLCNLQLQLIIPSPLHVVESNPGIMQCSDRIEVPAQIHSDTVQASLKTDWIRRCQSPVNTEHWHLSFFFSCPSAWNTCRFSGQRKDHVCTFSAVSSTCSAAYCRCCQHVWGEECTGSCGVSCHPSPCWSNAGQPAWDETQRVRPAAAAAPDEAATGMIICIMLGKKVGFQKMPFFLPPSLSIFSLLAFVQVSLSSKVLAKGRPKYYRHKSLHSPQGVRISSVKLLLLRYWEKNLISSFVGWL